MNLSNWTKITDVLDYASGTATRTGTAVDLQGWDGVLFVCKLAGIATGATGHDVHLVANTSASLTDLTDDVANSKVVIADDDDDQTVIIDYSKPLYRYVSAVVTKDGAHAQGESVVAILYSFRRLPVSNMGADTYLSLISPSKGTK